MPNNIKQLSDDGFVCFSSVGLFLKHAFDLYVYVVSKYGYKRNKVPLP